MATKSGNWIASATSNSHGQFASKAKKAGMSTAKFASKAKNSTNPVTARQANLAATLMKLNKKK